MNTMDQFSIVVQNNSLNVSVAAPAPLKIELLSGYGVPITGGPGGSFQPLNGNLTAIAALTTQAFGRGLLELADFSAALAEIGAAPAVHGHSILEISGLSPTDDVLFRTASLSSGVITTSQPAVNITQTWNNATITFTGFFFDITDTQSAANSQFMRLRLNGTNRFQISKLGNTSIHEYLYFRNDTQQYIRALSTDIVIATYGGYGVNVGPQYYGFASAHNQPTDLQLRRDGPGELGIHNGTNGQRINLFATRTDGNNFRRLFFDAKTGSDFTIGVEGLGTGAAGNSLKLQASANTFQEIHESAFLIKAPYFEVNTNNGQIMLGDTDSNFNGTRILINDADEKISLFALEVDVSGSLIVVDEAYGPSWNGDNRVPTRNAIYDKIESMSGAGGVSLDDVLAFSVAL